MPDYNWKAWQATAAANNGAPTLPAAEGYVGEIIDAGAKPTQKGTPQLWWQIKVLVGPYANTVEKMTQTLNPENPKALAAFYGVCERIGIGFDSVPDGTPPEAVAKLAIGRKIKFNFEHRVDTNTNRVYADFKRLELLEVATLNAAPPVVAPPVQAATAVVAAAPAAVVAEALASPSIEEQIAALQAQQVAAVAPVQDTVAAVPAKGKLPF
jgi:hypothetical protein